MTNFNSKKICVIFISFVYSLYGAKTKAPGVALITHFFLFVRLRHKLQLQFVIRFLGALVLALVGRMRSEMLPGFLVQTSNCRNILCSTSTP